MIYPTYYCPVCREEKRWQRYQHGSWYVWKCVTCHLDLQERDALIDMMMDDWHTDWKDEQDTIDSIIADMRRG